MQQQVEKLRAEGFKPTVYIDTYLLGCPSNSSELDDIVKKAQDLNVSVVYSNNDSCLSKIRKAYVFRYGSIAPHLIASIVRKKGTIVSGNLVV